MRPAPAGYTIHVTTAQAAIAALRSGQVTAISLDHDLGDETTCGTGYDVACVIEEMAQAGLLAPIEVHLHTANPVGRARMAQAIANARRHWNV